MPIVMIIIPTLQSVASLIVPTAAIPVALLPALALLLLSAITTAFAILARLPRAALLTAHGAVMVT